MDNSDDESNVNNENVEIVEIDADTNPTDELATDLLNSGLEDEFQEDEAAGGEEMEVIYDNSVYTIDKHTGSVFCIDVSKNYLASGGEDDKAFIWEYNGEHEKFNLYYESEKAKDSIISVKFSNDSKYLGTCDMSGFISVIEIEKKTVYWSFDIGSDIELLEWHPGCNVLFSGTSDGYLYMFKLSTSEIKTMCNGDSQSKVTCFKVLSDGKRAVSTYSTGQVIIWDLKTQQMLFNCKSNKDSTGEILCMDVSADGNLLAYGGVDLKLTILNINNGKIIETYDCNYSEKKAETDGEEVPNSIESVGFCKVLPLLACVTVYGEILIWDINSSILRHKSINEYKCGFSKLVWNQDYKLFISALSGQILEFDGRNLELKAKYEGHEAEILDFCLSKDFKYLFTASDDRKIKVFQINQ